MRCTLALTHVIKMMGRMFMRLTYFTITNTAIAALKGQFVGHCHHSIVFSKGPQTFFGNLLG